MLAVLSIMLVSFNITFNYACRCCIMLVGYCEIAKFQWLEHLVNHENTFEKMIVQVNEC